ncbi:phospholipase D family protein [Phaeobacter gallaeciensis]|uniref:phospholipase D family protein n=1 Tax=Phaeobacter gallaeciensis TaxID=60890 RepID=UPI001FD3370A|nr:phospholipase D family protein [Phaeobacter gallaeciensis]
MMKTFLRLIIRVSLIAAIAIMAARLIFPLPDISNRPVSSAIPISTTTPLGKIVSDGSASHGEDKTGVFPLANGHDALASRIALIEAAVQSVDAQYYIWHNDTSGILLMDALYQAAERGVRVRLLLDDNGVAGLDDFMAALNAHENFSIRLFNPSTIRRPKFLGYTFDFFRMNRRMHNKSLTVDGSVSIIGGRNIGDEYFQVFDDNYYIDLDVLAAGAVVPETARVFDQYWNSQSVFEVETVITGKGDLPAFQDRVEEVRSSAIAKEILQGAVDSATGYTNGDAELEWTRVELFADDPAKGLGVASPEQLLITRLIEILGGVETRLDMVSAYFVPAVEGTALFSLLSESGKQVNILTNALNTTDVLMVYAGYTKYRRDLLASGVNLYELKLRSTNAETQRMPLSGASLHAKTFAIDDARIFIGSFNFDPRSAALNCEMGFLVHSPSLAVRLSEQFNGPAERVSYQPMLTPEDKMVWQEVREDGELTIYQEEPGATRLQQILLVILGLLPIEWML